MYDNIERAVQTCRTVELLRDPAQGIEHWGVSLCLDDLRLADGQCRRASLKPETETPGFGYAPASSTASPKAVSVECVEERIAGRVDAATANGTSAGFPYGSMPREAR